MEPSYEHYRSFVMRIWRSGESRDASLRVSLVDPISGDQLGFTDIETLTSYVQEIITKELASEDEAQEGKTP